MKNFNTIIFDFDGPLCECTYDTFHDRYLMIVKQLQCKQPWGDGLEIFKNWHSCDYKRCYAEMGITTPEQFKAADDIFYAEVEKTHLLPESPEIIKNLAKKYSLGIVSFSSEKMIRRKLGELQSLFDCILGYDTIKKFNKPKAQGILKCLQEMNKNINESIYIADDASDIVFANEVGIPHTIGITWGLGDRDDLANAGASEVFEDKKELLEL